MGLMKKFISYFFLVIFVLASLVGVYFFIVKGYSGERGGLVENIENVIDNKTDENKEIGNDQESIPLTITSPENGAKLTSTNVSVKGKTVPNAEVFVNDAEGTADANGNFSISIGLEEGENQIIINANDEKGNVAEKVLTVTISSFE